MGNVIKVDGYPYRELTEIYHAPANQGWVHNEFRSIEKYEKNHHELPKTVFVDYLKESYELHKYRFSHYHPWISEKIACETIQPTKCDAVPEPTPIIIGFIAIIYIAVWKLLRGKNEFK
jgi:hypothetical protein